MTGIYEETTMLQMCNNYVATLASSDVVPAHLCHAKIRVELFIYCQVQQT